MGWARLYPYRCHRFRYCRGGVWLPESKRVHRLEILRWLAAGFSFSLRLRSRTWCKILHSERAYDFFAAFNPATYKNSPYNWFQRAMQIIAWACMVAIVAGLFLFDYVSVNAVRDPVFNMVKKNKLNQDSIRRAVDAQEQARIGAVVEAIRGIEIDIRQTERQIEATKQRVPVRRALRRLAESGNGWAKVKFPQNKGKGNCRATKPTCNHPPKQSRLGSTAGARPCLPFWDYRQNR